MKGLVNINFKPTKAPKAKLNKFDPKVLIDDTRLGHLPRLKKEDDSSLELCPGQPLQIKGSPKKILEVILGEKNV